MTTITKSVITMSQRARLHDPRSHLPSTECRHGIPSCALHSLRGPSGFLPADLAVAHDPPETESSRGSRRLHAACPPRGGRPGRSLAGAVTRVRHGGDRLAAGAGNSRSNAPSGDPALTMPRRRHAAEQHAPRCELPAARSVAVLRASAAYERACSGSLPDGAVADYMGAGLGRAPIPAQPGSATLRVSDELGKEARDVCLCRYRRAPQAFPGGGSR
jgi:hypothetical protein